MNFITKTLQRFIPSTMLVFNGQNTPDIKTVSTDKKKRVSYALKRTRTYLGDIQMDVLNSAIMEAEDPTNPNRANLLEIYRQALKDRHLRSLIRSAIVNVICEPYAIVSKKDKSINTELTDMMRKKWHRDIQKLYLEAEFWGFSVPEFGQMVWDEDRKGWAFDTVKSFPREHIRPETMEIILDPHNSTAEGFPLNEAPFNTWLLFCGDPEDIGLLCILAPGAIWKKFTMADWSRSGEKFCDPILVVRTDSDDDTENDKKEEMAANFGNNSYAIFDKEDEINLLERKNTDAYKLFVEFIKLQNDESSKAVNGQTGTTEEKAFVGSAEVHERQLDKYTETRLQDLTDFENDKHIPYLIKCNNGDSIYKALEGHMFMPLRFLKDIKDPNEEVEELDPTNPTPPNPNKSNGGATGKKLLSRPSEALSKLYDQCTCGTALHNIRLGYETPGINMDLIIQKAINRMYDNKLQAGQVDAALYKANAETLWKGILDGWNKDPEKMKYGSVEHRLMLNLRHNVYVTAAFKVHHNTLEMAQAIFDKDGNIRSKAEFIKAAKAINTTYNKRHLETEYNLATANARMGSKFVVFKAKGGKLMFKTIGDGRVRDEHAILNGIVKSVNDAFWFIHYPPLGWGCRCYVIWVPDSEPDVEPTQGLPDIPEMFRNNVGITGKVFNEATPYFDVDSEFAKDAKKVFNVRLPISPEELDANIKEFNKLQDNKQMVLEFVDNLSGGYVFRSKLARAAEFADNMPIARTIAAEGKAVVMTEWKNLANIKSPDFTVAGAPAELKTISGVSYNNIDGAIKTAKSQANHVILSLQKGYNLKALEKAMYDRTLRSTDIEKITVITPKGVYHCSRAEILARTFLGKIK